MMAALENENSTLPYHFFRLRLGPTASILGSMVQAVHPASDELKAYSFGLLSDADSCKIEEHLLTCVLCQQETAFMDQEGVRRAAASAQSFKPLRSIHITEDGPIFGAIHCTNDGRWVARHWGRQLDGGRVCGSVEAADEYLTESFQQMFPEHQCTRQCRD